MWPTQTFVIKPTDHPERPYETGVSPTATLALWAQASSRKQYECWMHGISNILELIATFLYSIYQQQAGKTNLFHVRGGRFHTGNTICTFKWIRESKTRPRESLGSLSIGSIHEEIHEIISLSSSQLLVNDMHLIMVMISCSGLLFLHNVPLRIQLCLL